MAGIRDISSDPAQQAVGLRGLFSGSSGLGSRAGTVVAVGAEQWRVRFDDGREEWKRRCTTKAIQHD
jgi:hypothetical protein